MNNEKKTLCKLNYTNLIIGNHIIFVSIVYNISFLL